MKPPKQLRRNAFALDSAYSASKPIAEEAALQEEDDSNEWTTQLGITVPKDVVNAFKEVFDLFDSNGGGTIDAEELDLALRSVDIQLSQDEIIDVLTTMDRDGNGEIDFDEFLNLMTNTERFLEGLGPDNGQDIDKESPHYRRRETMLFEALTNFMKKSALHSIDEIVGYYHTKYKRAQAPHVVGHYAAGARLIGLTEFQMRKHMESLRDAKHAVGHENSPYAEPVHIVFEHIPKQKPKKKKDELPPRGRIRLRFNTTRFHNNAFQQPESAKNTPNLLNPNVKARGHPSLPVPLRILPRRRPEDQQIKKPPMKLQRIGWKSQRILPFHVEMPVRCKRMNNLPGKLNAKVMTFDYLPAIRDEVAKAREHFMVRLQDQKRKESHQHWKDLQSDNIQSHELKNKFRMAFNAYTQFLQIDEPQILQGNVWKPNAEDARSKSVVERKIDKVIQNERRSKSTI